MINKVNIYGVNTEEFYTMTKEVAKELMEQGHEIFIVRTKPTGETPFICFRCKKDKYLRYYGNEYTSNVNTRDVNTIINVDSDITNGQVIGGWWGFFITSEHSMYTSTRAGELTYVVKYTKGYVNLANTEMKKKVSNRIVDTPTRGL